MSELEQKVNLNQIETRTAVANEKWKLYKEQALKLQKYELELAMNLY